MLEFLKNHPRYLVGAIVVHVFFIVLFGVGFHFKSERRAASETPQTVTVNTVDESQVKKELQQLKAQDAREKREREELIRQRKAEEQRLDELRRQREAEQRKEKERLALLEEKKQREAEQRRLEEQRRKEEARKEQQRREKELQEKLQAEERRLQEEQAIAAQRRAELQKQQTKIDKYMNLIETQIYQKWTKPPSADKGLVCVLEVRLIPSGEVINIELSQSSGDKEYDQSVIAAVKKASPLPLPPAEDNLFEVFRDLKLPVRADKKT